MGAAQGLGTGAPPWGPCHNHATLGALHRHGEEMAGGET